MQPPYSSPSSGDLDPAGVPPVLDALDEANARLRDALDSVPESALKEPSQLEGWSRATVLAHLRYVAGASGRLTDDALAGRPAAFYPGGATEREQSLQLADDESLGELVADLFAQSDQLSQKWRGLSETDWKTELREPRFGRMLLTRPVALRLTEVEVHGVDLGLDSLTRWSDRFVEICLPLRIAWLPNHSRAQPSADRSVNGRWLLRAHTGSSWLVSAAGGLASAAPKDDMADDAVDCVISGSERELLGLVLGRVPVTALGVAGDQSLAHAFKAAFPGP